MSQCDIHNHRANKRVPLLVTVRLMTLRRLPVVPPSLIPSRISNALIVWGASHTTCSISCLLNVSNRVVNAGDVRQIILIPFAGGRAAIDISSVACFRSLKPLAMDNLTETMESVAPKVEYQMRNSQGCIGAHTE